MSASLRSSECDHSLPVSGRFVLSIGRPRIEDQGADQAQEGVVFGISRPAEEGADFYITHLPA